MEIRKLDTDADLGSLTVGPISIGSNVEGEGAAPEPLLAPLDRFVRGDVFLDGARTRWVRTSSLGSDAARYNRTMRGL